MKVGPVSVIFIFCIILETLDGMGACATHIS